MSKLFKSKFLLGIFVLAAFVVTTATADAFTYTGLLKLKSTGPSVMDLQQTLNANGFTVSSTGAGSPGQESSYFGTKTKSAVMAFQSANGLVADGVVGPNTGAALAGLTGSMTGGMTYPAGCSSSSGYSVTTGQSCSSGTVSTVPGCMAGYMYSPINGQLCSGGNTTTQTGPLTAMLAYDNPASSTLVTGQATADLLHIAFNGSGTITNVTLRRLGVSADTTPSNVYLFDGVTRLTDAASVSNDGMVTFNNPTGLFTVGGSKTIAVKSDIALNSSGQTLGFQLVSFTVSGGAAVTANLSGNLHTIASSTLASVSASTVTPTGGTLNPGAGVTVWQSTLTVSTRDVLMKRIAFRNIGSAPASAFGGFKLFVNGVQVATATGLDVNGYVTFDLGSSPVSLQSGARVMRLDADIISGASRTVQFSLRNAADVDFVDSSFGVNITPTSTPWGSTSANTISSSTGGTVTVEKDVSSPSQNIVASANDTVLGVFKITSFGEPVKIETLTAGFTTSDGSLGSLRNGRLLFSTDGTNWTQYGSTSTLVVTTGTSYTTNYTINPGTPVWVQVRADVYDNDGTNNVSASDTITATIVAGSSNAQKLDSLGALSVPGSTVSGNTLTVGTTSLALSKNSTYANQTTTLPVTNFKIGSWNLSGSSVEDVLLTTLSFDVDEVNSTGGTLNESDLLNMYVVVKNGSTIVAQPSPFATVSAADNNFSINYTLPKNGSVTIELFANLSDAATAAIADNSFKTDLTVTGTSLVSGSSVTATSADTDGQTIAYGTATITASVDASSADIAILSDNQTVDAAAFKFSAVTAGFNVTDVTIAFPGTNAATVVQNVMLYDGATLVASLPGGASSVAFSGLNWNVPANTSKVLTVKLQVGTVGLGAGSAGAAITTRLSVFTAVNTSTGTSDASDADAGPSIESPANPTGSALYVYAAIPTISQGSVSSSLTNAIENDIYKFTVNPNGGNIALKQLKFTIVVNDNVGTNDTLAVGTFKLFRGSTDITSSVDIHNTAGATIESTNTLGEGTNTAIVTWATEEQISSATEFTLKATPTGFSTSADDDYINTTLAYDSAAATAGNSYLIDLDQTTAQVTIGLQNADADASEGTIAATVTTGPNVVWSDISALPHTETATDDADGTQDDPTSSADWFNGYLIQSMPLAGMQKNN